MYDAGTFRSSYGFHARVDAAAHAIGIVFLRGERPMCFGQGGLEEVRMREKEETVLTQIGWKRDSSYYMGDES